MPTGMPAMAKNTALKRFVGIIDRLIIRIETNPEDDPSEGTGPDEGALAAICTELGIVTPPLSRHYVDNEDGLVNVWICIEPEAEIEPPTIRFIRRHRTTGKVLSEEVVEPTPLGVTAHVLTMIRKGGQRITIKDEDGSVRRRVIQTLRLWKHAALTCSPPFAKAPKSRRRRGPQPAAPKLQRIERKVFDRWKQYRENVGPDKKAYLNEDMAWIKSTLGEADSKAFTYTDLCRLIERVTKRKKRAGESD